jgi:hypothetical protein
MSPSPENGTHDSQQFHRLDLHINNEMKLDVYGYRIMSGIPDVEYEPELYTLGG